MYVRVYVHSLHIPVPIVVQFHYRMRLNFRGMKLLRCLRFRRPSVNSLICEYFEQVLRNRICEYFEQVLRNRKNGH